MRLLGSPDLCSAMSGAGAGVGRARVARPHCGGGSTTSPGRAGLCKGPQPQPAAGAGAGKAVLLQFMELEAAAHGMQAAGHHRDRMSCLGGQADTEHALLGLAQTLLGPAMVSLHISQLGQEASPQAGGAEPSVSLSAEPLLIPSLLFLAQQPRAVGFSVFFFFSSQ